MNQVWAIVDWFSTRTIEKNILKRKTFLGQIRGRQVLIFIPTISKYNEFFPCIFFQLDAPSFMEALPLCSLSLSFHLSLPLVDQVDDFLDACPIKTFLRLNITIQALLPYKCNQMVKCRTFNVVVAAFFSYFSQFTVDSSLSCLSSKAWLPLVRYLLGGRPLDSHIASRGSLAHQETSLVSCYRPLSLAHQPTCPFYCLTVLGLLGILRRGPQPNTHTQFF